MNQTLPADHMISNDGGQTISVYSGREAVNIVRAYTLWSSLKLYAATGMKPNRMVTPKMMMALATEITGQKFKARDYLVAAETVKAWADEKKAAMPVVIS